MSLYDFREIDVDLIDEVKGQEGEPGVDMFLDGNMWSQNLSHVFLFRNISASDSYSFFVDFQVNTLSLVIMSLLLVLSCIINVCFARYDAYVTSDGTNNAVCSQSKPCGLFQYVIRNIESGHISDDDLVIHINGSNATINDDSYCKSTFTGNITFILDPDTINSASDWFGSGVLESCSVYLYNCYVRSICTYNLLTVDVGAHVSFYNLRWDHSMPFLQSFKDSSFHCYHCRIANSFYQYPLFLLSNEATFTDSNFHGLFDFSSEMNIPVIRLFPMSQFKASLSFPPENQETNTVLTLNRCTVSMIQTKATFIDVEASNGMLLMVT